MNHKYINLQDDTLRCKPLKLINVEHKDDGYSYFYVDAGDGDIELYKILTTDTIRKEKWI